MIKLTEGKHVAHGDGSHMLYTLSTLAHENRPRVLTKWWQTRTVPVCRARQEPSPFARQEPSPFAWINLVKR